MASKKIQLPAIGGIRKVVKVGDDTSKLNPGTTISEFANQVITLAQLKAALGLTTAITNPPPGGSGTPGSLIVGPGLSGGGPLVGAVPLYLTAPIPVFFDSDGGGGDGEPGPPGISGASVTGAGGPAGPAVFLAAEDGQDGADGIPGGQGPAGNPGASGTNGPAVFFIADDGEDGQNAIPGSVGPQGITGLAGTNGPATFFVADDGEDGQTIPGRDGLPGITGAAGPAGPAIGFLGIDSLPIEMPFVPPPSVFRIVTKGANWVNATAISPGSANIVYVNCPVGGFIQRVRMVTSGGPGSCVVDIWKAPFGSFPPLVGNSITASAKPTISSGTTYIDGTLTGWTRAIDPGDVLAFVISSSSVFTQIQIVLEVLQ